MKSLRSSRGFLRVTSCPPWLFDVCYLELASPRIVKPELPIQMFCLYRMASRSSEVLSKSSIENRTSSIPECLSCLQCELNPFLRLLLSTQRLEPFPLQIQDVLFAYWRTGSHIPAAQDFRDLRCQLHFVFRDVLTLPHQMHTHLQGRQNVFARRGNVRARHRRLIAAAQHF